MVLKPGLMAHNTKANTLMAKNKEKENSIGLMVQHMKENFMTTILRDSEFISGQMVEGLKELGKKT